MEGRLPKPLQDGCGENDSSTFLRAPRGQGTRRPPSEWRASSAAATSGKRQAPRRLAFLDGDPRLGCNVARLRTAGVALTPRAGSVALSRSTRVNATRAWPPQRRDAHSAAQTTKGTGGALARRGRSSGGASRSPTRRGLCAALLSNRRGPEHSLESPERKDSTGVAVPVTPQSKSECGFRTSSNFDAESGRDPRNANQSRLPGAAELPMRPSQLSTPT